MLLGLIMHEAMITSQSKGQRRELPGKVYGGRGDPPPDHDDKTGRERRVSFLLPFHLLLVPPTAQTKLEAREQRGISRNQSLEVKTQTPTGQRRGL